MNILINGVEADQQKYAHSSLTIFYVFLKNDGADINECNKYYFNPREQLSESIVWKM